MRLTKNVRDQLLSLNEGFQATTYYKGKNFKETRIYSIIDGVLFIRSIGKSSWADSRFDNERKANEEETHRFLKRFLGKLNKGDLE